MKAERRHELKHNELADWLGEHLEVLRPHATGIVVGLVILAVVVLGSFWYLSGESHATSRAWSVYFDAFNEREPQKALQSVATEHSGSKAAWWALEAVGDMNLGEGAALLYSDRGEAQKRLEAAEKAYKQVEASDDPMLKARARLGLAKLKESMCMPEEAHKYYKLVADSEKDSAIGKAAAADAARMKDSREVAFLDWFAKQTPRRPAPMPGIGGGVPGLPSSLPDRPDIELPSTALDLGKIGTGVPSEPTPSFPAPASTLPTTPPAEPAAPSGEKTGEAKPASAPAPESAKPAAPEGSEKKSD